MILTYNNVHKVLVTEYYKNVCGRNVHGGKDDIERQTDTLGQAVVLRNLEKWFKRHDDDDDDYPRTRRKVKK